jgi:hypothetical protein
MSKSYTLNRDAIFFFFDVGRVKVNLEKKTTQTHLFFKILMKNFWILI